MGSVGSTAIWPLPRRISLFEMQNKIQEVQFQLNIAVTAFADITQDRESRSNAVGSSSDIKFAVTAALAETKNCQTENFGFAAVYLQ